jgi:hypothetical protein
LYDPAPPEFYPGKGVGRRYGNKEGSCHHDDCNEKRILYPRQYIVLVYHIIIIFKIQRLGKKTGREFVNFRHCLETQRDCPYYGEKEEYRDKSIKNIEKKDGDVFVPFHPVYHAGSSLAMNLI